MNFEKQNELLFNTLIALLKELKAYQLFVDWMKDKAGSHSQDIEDVLSSIRLEIANEPALESKLRGIVEDALQSGETNLDLALALALQRWNPKGKVN